MQGLSPQVTEEYSSVQTIILAASHHDLQSLRTLLRSSPPNVQDAETGTTPLHAAIAACEEDPNEGPDRKLDGELSNGETPTEESTTREALLEAAEKTVRLLLQNGAIWNIVDKKDETPGCLALRIGLTRLYDIMVDAGVRAELLLTRLDEYQRLADDEDEDEESQIGDAEPEKDVSMNVDPDGENVNSQETASNLLPAQPTSGPYSEDFLRSNLRFSNERILDSDANGVMMAWEDDLMKRTADLLVPSDGLRILNIGHGMGIIDNFFQAKSPSSHHIIEAHPEVLIQMRGKGWNDKPNIVIHEGRWQDVVPKLLEEEQMFDAIYFDTFAEDYKALRQFFDDSVIGLLDDGGRWGFFNGLGADRQICYDVYGKIVEMDLFEAGFDTEWETIEIPPMGDEEWNGAHKCPPQYSNIKFARPRMPPPNPVVIATSSLNRLVKEETTYRKELAQQEERLRKLEQGGGDDDENRGFYLNQEKKSIEETKAVFGPLKDRTAEAVNKLREVLETSAGDASDSEISAAEKALKDAGHSP